MKSKENKMSPNRIKFLEKYGEFNETEMLRELLFAQEIQIEKLEKIRSNTAIFIWWLVAIPLIFIILVIFGSSLI